MSGAGGNRAVIAALLANLGIALIKFFAFVITSSASMLAETIHSTADSGNQVLLLLGAKRAKRAPTQEHPFGFGRERYVFAFVVSIVLFSLGGLFALFEAWNKFQHLLDGNTDGGLLESKWKWVPLVVLAIAMVLEGFSFRTAVREADHARGNRGWWAFVRGAKAPELPVILLEDLAALIGLAVAFIGVTLAILTHNLYFDVVGSGVIGALLVAVAVILAIEMESLLVGESADPAAVQRIRNAISGTAGVERIIHMRTLHLGPEELLVAVKVSLGADVDAERIASIIDSIESNVRAVEPMAGSMYVEPDIYRADYTQPERPQSPSAPSP